MADITKCTNDECPMTDSCLRATAQSSEFQSFQKFDFEIVVVKDEYGSPFEAYNCENFLVNNQNQI
jgi:hypothetical protein